MTSFREVNGERGQPVREQPMPPNTTCNDSGDSHKNCLDAQLKKLINGPEGFDGRMKNQANIGISNEDLKALWGADHPDDPLEI